MKSASVYWASSYGYPARRGRTDSAGTTWFVGSDNGSLRLSRRSGWATPGAGRTVLSLDTSRFGVVAMATQFGQAGLSNLDMTPTAARRYGFAASPLPTTGR